MENEPQPELPGAQLDDYTRRVGFLNCLGKLQREIAMLNYFYLGPRVIRHTDSAFLNKHNQGIQRLSDLVDQLANHRPLAVYMNNQPAGLLQGQLVFVPEKYTKGAHSPVDYKHLLINTSKRGLSIDPSSLCGRLSGDEAEFFIEDSGGLIYTLCPTTNTFDTDDEYRDAVLAWSRLIFEKRLWDE